MPSFKFEQCKKDSFLEVNLDKKRIQFDYPAEIFGTNLRIGTKPILLKVKKTSARKIFVSSDSSLGIFFVKKNLQVFITRPVYEQLVIRLKELQGYLVDYDDEIEKSHVFDVNDVNLKKTERQIVFINYEQTINFRDFVIEVISSNTFLGWCNFIIKIGKKRLAYISSFSSKGRVSHKMEKRKLDLIAFNDRDQNPHESGLDDFLGLCKEESIKVIPIEMSSLFLEIFLFLLNTTRNLNLKIWIVFPFYEKLNRLINGSGTWLNQKFKIELQDPLPLDIKNVLYCNTLSDLIDVEDDSIIFCSKEEFDIVNNSMESSAYYEHLIKKMKDDRKVDETKGREEKQVDSMESSVDEEIEERTENINIALKDMDRDLLFKFFKDAILSCDTSKSKCLFKKKYAVLNVINYDMPSDYYFNFQLNSKIPEIRSFYGDPVVLSNKNVFLKQSDFFMKNGETIVVDTPRDNFYKYTVENGDVLLFDGNNMLFDGAIKNGKLICGANRLKQLFREDYYFYNDFYFFPGQRKKLKLVGEVFYMFDY